MAHVTNLVWDSTNSKWVRLSVDESGNLLVAVSQLDTIVNPAENVYVYSQTGVDLNKASDTELFTIPDTINYTSIAVLLTNVNSGSPSVCFHTDMSADQSAVYGTVGLAGNRLGFHKHVTGAVLAAGVIAEDQLATFCAASEVVPMPGSALRCYIEVDGGASSTGDIYIWLRGG